ncbi:MAG: hypothetical protein ACTSWW_04825 [Promethearchaeota archaeon]
MAITAKKRMKWTDAQKDTWHRKQGHVLKMVQDYGEKRWVQNTPIDETIWFGNPHTEKPKYFRQIDNLGSISEIREMFPVKKSLLDPDLLVEMLRFLGYSKFAESWKTLKNSDRADEALFAMNTIVSSKISNNEIVKPHAMSERQMENAVLAL